jgi:DNA-directed RNA polymerase subunit E'
MFKILTIKDEVRVQPKFFGMPTEEAIKESLKTQIEGKMDPDIGVFLAVTKINEFGEGKIKPEDPSIHYPASFEILAYIPEDQEIVYGPVMDITEFGAFVRVGPIDGLVHTSQIMNDRVNYDQKNCILSGKKTNKKIEQNEIVRARIVSISLGKARTKIGLTMRQPLLGTVKWIEVEKKQGKAPAASKSAERAEKPVKKGKK